MEWYPSGGLKLVQKSVYRQKNVFQGSQHAPLQHEDGVWPRTQGTVWQGEPGGVRGPEGQLCFQGYGWPPWSTWWSSLTLFAPVLPLAMRLGISLTESRRSSRLLPRCRRLIQLPRGLLQQFLQIVKSLEETLTSLKGFEDLNNHSHQHHEQQHGSRQWQWESRRQPSDRVSLEGVVVLQDHVQC